MSGRRLLLVEDEPGLVLTLTDRLRAEGYIVDSALDAPTGLALGASGEFDAIILDVMLPGGNGFDICRTLRARGISTPIVILTALGQLSDRVNGLKLGADDYLVKPFEMAELLARIEALLRRAPARPGGGHAFTFGEVTVDLRRAVITRRDERIDLSAREFKLLRYFIEHRGGVLTRDELLTHVWGHSVSPSTRTVDVHVAWLRQKIEETPRHPQYLLTVHGIGYKFVV